MTAHGDAHHERSKQNTTTKPNGGLVSVILLRDNENVNDVYQMQGGLRRADDL